MTAEGSNEVKVKLSCLIDKYLLWVFLRFTHSRSWHALSVRHNGASACVNYFPFMPHWAPNQIDPFFYFISFLHKQRWYECSPFHRALHKSLDGESNICKSQNQSKKKVFICCSQRSEYVYSIIKWFHWTSFFPPIFLLSTFSYNLLRVVCLRAYSCIRWNFEWRCIVMSTYDIKIAL